MSGYRQIDPYLNGQGDPFYHPTLIGSQFFECIGLVKSLKVLADASLDSQSVTPTPHFAIALSFSRMAFEMNLK
jgi:hypothetical protein